MNDCESIAASLAEFYVTLWACKSLVAVMRVTQWARLPSWAAVHVKNPTRSQCSARHVSQLFLVEVIYFDFAPVLTYGGPKRRDGHLWNAQVDGIE